MHLTVYIWPKKMCPTTNCNWYKTVQCSCILYIQYISLSNIYIYSIDFQPYCAKQCNVYSKSRSYIHISLLPLWPTVSIQDDVWSHLSENDSKATILHVQSVGNAWSIYVIKHKQTCGQKARQFGCTICDKTFKLETYMAAHLKSEQDTLSPRFQCTSCGKRYTYRSSLSHHLNHGKCRHWIACSVLPVR
jgi:hypothetical protein